DNCAEAVESVEVTDLVIAAGAEAVRPATGSDSDQAMGNVLDAGNDVLDGAAAVPGAGGNVVLSAVADPGNSAFLAVDPATGALTLTGGAPAGTHALRYRICEAANADNCAEAVETVEVTDRVIAAGPEAVRPVIGADAAQAAGSVLSALNDTLDGVAVVLGDSPTVVLSRVAGANSAPELSVDGYSGTLLVAAGTPAGSYTLEYRICEIGNADNCATAIETVEITDTPIAAAAEADRPLFQQSAAQAAGTVLDAGNDLLDGAAATLGGANPVTLTLVSADPGLTLDTATGVITVAGDQPLGRHTLTYRICEPANGDNCAEATEAVVISLTPIAAAAEAPRNVTGQDEILLAGNVLDAANDLLDGAAAVAGDTVILSAVAGPDTAAELSLDPATGELRVAAGTAPGSYTLRYRICEAANPVNCAEAVETVVVTDRPILAASEPTRQVMQASTQVGAGSALAAGDTLDGIPVTPGDGGTVVLTLVGADAGLSLDPETGLIAVAANQPLGTHTLTYRICEAVNADNCATATETVEVARTTLQAVAEPTRALTGSDDELPAGLVLGAGDVLDGVQAAAGPSGNVDLTTVAIDAALTLDTETGELTVGAGTAAGTYTVTYRICEKTNPGNCAEATETVTVTDTALAAGPEPVRALAGSDAAQSAGNALDPSNDTL
ncbi:hypothetical protein, partial [Pseudaestuariivita atlantica]